jgi:hypothetical protein
MPDMLNDIIDPVELTSFIRSLTDDLEGPGSLNRFLPNQFRLALEAEFAHAIRERTAVAHYRAFDVPADLSSRPGFSKSSVAIPPISRKMLLSEADRTRLNLALAGGLANNASHSRWLEDIIFNDAERITREVLARLELARGSVLRTGTVTFTADERLELTVDFNDGPRSILTNSASPLWTVANAATATPIQDMREWMETYGDNNEDDRPVVGLTSAKVITRAMGTTEVKDLFQNVAGNSPAFVTEGQFAQLLSAFGLPPLVEYKTRLNVDGTVTRVLNEDEIVWLPAPSVDTFGETMYGVGSEALDLVQMGGIDISTAPGLTGRAWKTIDPPQNWVRVGGIAMPILKDAGRIMVSTVTTG